jgi:hypothetical protein
MFLFSEASRLALGPTMSLIQWVLRFIPGGTVARLWSQPLTPSSTMVKNESRYTSIAPVCLHSMDRENFTFFTMPLILKLEEWVIKNNVTACLTTPCLLVNNVSIHVTAKYCKALHLYVQPFLWLFPVWEQKENLPVYFGLYSTLYDKKCPTLWFQNKYLNHS